MLTRKAWVGAIAVGPLLIVGLVFSPTRQKYENPAALAAGEQHTYGAVSGAGPVRKDRRARLQEALRGLSFESGFVEPAPGWQTIVAELGRNRNVQDLAQEALAHIDRNLLVEALESYKLAVLQDPGDPLAVFGLGRVLAATGQIEYAVTAFRSALELDGDLHEARYGLALSYWRMGEYDSSLATFDELLARNPNHPDAHGRLAICLYYLGRYSEAWEHLHAAEALRHDVPPQFRPLLETRMPEPPPEGAHP